MKSSLGNSDEINLIVALSVVAKPRGEHKETNSKEMKSNGQITTKWPFIETTQDKNLNFFTP